MSSDNLPLKGIRVADFSWFGAGPIFTMALAHYGAEVIRVESQIRLDGLRITQPMPKDKPPGINLSGYYNNFNAGKLSFALNMASERGRELALRLIARSDIVAENFTPGTFEKWGLTYERIVQVKPDIIMVREPMQGLTGPHRDFAGFGAVITPLAGLSYLSGFPHRPPVGLGTNYTDYVVNPGQALVANLAALHYRNRTGKGQRIDIALLDSLITALDNLGERYTVDPRSVHAYIVGEHGDSEVPLWSLANIAGVRLRDFTSADGTGYDEAALQRIFEQTRDAAYSIIERKGATYYAIGLGLLSIVEAILRDQHTVMTVSSLMPGQYGVSDMCASLPSIVGAGGIEEVLNLSLSADEEEAFRRSAATLKERFQQIPPSS